MTAFTHYWKNDTVEHMRANGNESEPLDHTADNGFVKAGIKKGDSVYVITVVKGELFLVASMTVSKIASKAEARALLGDDIWLADDHLIANESGSTPMKFQRRVPIDIVQKLLFETNEGPKPLTFKSPGRLDQQTLRGVRRLTPASADLLDSVLRR